MNDAKFRELVNLYLDNEISAADLRLLKAEIEARPDRKRALIERYRLHKAMRVALKPEVEEHRLGQSRWFLGTGLAASLLVAFVLLTPVFRGAEGPHVTTELVIMEAADPVQSDPLGAVEKSDFRRYASLLQSGDGQRHASLVSQMRLMGLRPELTPRDKQLREVDAVVSRPTVRSVSQEELYWRIQGLESIPESSAALRSDEMGFDDEASLWPEAFQSSLVDFDEL